MITFDPATSPPVPVPNELTRFYWDAVSQGRLDLLRCQTCGHYIHYPRPVCDRCLSTNTKPATVSGRGTLYSYCEAMHTSHPYFVDKIPYLLGIIDIEEEPGIRIPAGLVECTSSDLKCGIAMEVVFRQLTPTLMLPFFRPSRGDQ